MIQHGELPDEGPARYGAHAPDPLTRVMLWLTRATPLGHGWPKRQLYAAITRTSGGVVDGKLFGKPMRCHLGDNRCEWKAFLRPSGFDPLERREIARRLDKPQAVFVDIGANVGVHTLAAASAARHDARILAFEPHPVTFARLKFNVAHCGHSGVFPLQVALGAQEGEATMGGEDLSLASLAVAGAGPRVKVRPLVACLGEFDVGHIDVLKIDVEGYEDKVLEPFVRDAPDALLPGLVIIEHLGRHIWAWDCIEGLRGRGLEIVARAGNNTFLARGDAGQ